MESASRRDAAGSVAVFIDYLHVSGLFDERVSRCPMRWTSPNAPPKIDVLGTMLLSVLSGHQRYVRINALRGDGVNPGLLGMSKVVSEDALRRSCSKIPEEEGIPWLQESLYRVYSPVLRVPWIFLALVKYLKGKNLNLT